MDATNLVMEAARRLDESRRDTQDEEGGAEKHGEDDWFGIAEERPDANQIKRNIKWLLKRRFGRRSRRLSRAVDRCGDSFEELNDLAERLEKYVRLFLDNHEAPSFGKEIRKLIAESPVIGSSQGF